VLCNDADIAADGDPVGDPTEVALLWAALRQADVGIAMGCTGFRCGPPVPARVVVNESACLHAGSAGCCGSEAARA
jgi:hypothetical protein